jgi:hypothetical protein
MNYWLDNVIWSCFIQRPRCAFDSQHQFDGSRENETSAKMTGIRGLPFQNFMRAPLRQCNNHHAITELPALKIPFIIQQLLCPSNKRKI